MFLRELKKTDPLVRDANGKPLRGLRKELALKARAETSKWDPLKDKETEYHYGTAKVSRSKVTEDALETKTAEDLWDEHKDDAEWYISSTQYVVRPIPNTKPIQYEAFSVQGSAPRKPFGKFTVDKLADTLQPIRPGQTPDAEGFTTYIDPEKVQAFEYEGDPIKVVLGKEGGARLNDGDYVIRSNDGNNFEYSIEQKAAFESTLVKTK